MSTTNSMTVRQAIHNLVYGDPGSKKSTFAATYPKPMAVFFFDPIGKDGPYLRQGNPTELYQADGEDFLTRDVLDADGNLLIRLQYFGDINPKKPTGYKAFLRRMQDFYAEVPQWATAVLDSVTFMELGARKNEQYNLNPKTKDPRQWWAGSTDSIEEMLQGSFGAMPINVVVIAHIDEHKDEFNGQILRRPKAPGRLSKGLAAGYSEIYHAYVGHGEQGEKLWLLQTSSDNTWICESQINAPDPSWGNYESLWTE
jgi:hypothetical protein